MNNLLASLKRMLGNKNTVTIIGVLIGVAVILIGYNYRVTNAVKPVEVPYAKVKILGKTELTNEFVQQSVGSIKVSQSFIDETPTLIRNRSQLIGKFVNYDTVIPEGALFYSSQIVNEDQIPDNAFSKIKDGYTIFSLSVDLHSTYGNSIMPGNYIDLYMKATDDNGLLIFGKFIESIEVLGVRDSGGNDIFIDSTATASPSELLFAVPDDLFLLLSKAVNLGTNNISILPVPRNKSYSLEAAEKGEGATWVTSDQLQEMILSKSIVVQQNEKPTDETLEDTLEDTNNNINSIE